MKNDKRSKINSNSKLPGNTSFRTSSVFKFQKSSTKGFRQNTRRPNSK